MCGYPQQWTSCVPTVRVVLLCEARHLQTTQQVFKQGVHECV